LAKYFGSNKSTPSGLKMQDFFTLFFCIFRS